MLPKSYALSEQGPADRAIRQSDLARMPRRGFRVDILQAGSMAMPMNLFPADIAFD